MAYIPARVKEFAAEVERRNPEDKVIAVVLDGQGNPYDATFNCESAIQYASDGYDVVAIRRDRSRSRAEIQQMIATEHHARIDCFGR